MLVERRIEQLVGRQLVLDLPEKFENHRIEIIVLTMDDDMATPETPRPRHALAGTMTYDDNLFDSIPIADWGLEP